MDQTTPKTEPKQMDATASGLSATDVDKLDVSEKPAKNDQDTEYQTRIRRFQSASQDYYEWEGIPGGEIKNKALLKNLATRPDYVDMAVKALSGGLEGISYESSASQAKLRVFSIEILEQASRFGSDEPLVQVVSDLKQKVRTGQKAPSGVEHDLVDCIFAWINSHDKSALAESPEMLFERLGYSPEFRPYFSKALNYAFNQNLSPVFIEKIKSLLIRDFLT